MPCLDLQICTQDAAVAYNWFCHLMSEMSADVSYQVNFARLCQMSEINIRVSSLQITNSVFLITYRDIFNVFLNYFHIIKFEIFTRYIEVH